MVADAVSTPYQAVVQAGVGPGHLVVVTASAASGPSPSRSPPRSAPRSSRSTSTRRSSTRVAAHGAAKTLDVRELDPKALKKEIGAFAKAKGLPSREWTIFETSGTAAGQATAFGLLVHGGTLAVVGFTPDKVELRLSNLMAFDARAHGNWGCLPELYPAALDLVLAGKVALLPFVERHPLAEVNRVLRDVHAHKLTRRAILVPA